MATQSRAMMTKVARFWCFKTFFGFVTAAKKATVFGRRDIQTLVCFIVSYKYN